VTDAAQRERALAADMQPRDPRLQQPCRRKRRDLVARQRVDALAEPDKPAAPRVERRELRVRAALRQLVHVDRRAARQPVQQALDWTLR